MQRIASALLPCRAHFWPAVPRLPTHNAAAAVGAVAGAVVDVARVAAAEDAADPLGVAVAVPGAVACGFRSFRARVTYAGAAAGCPACSKQRVTRGYKASRLASLVLKLVV